MHNFTNKRLLLCAIILSTLLGCGRNERMAMEGTVTLDGRPLEKGSIQFIPLSGTEGPTAGGEIVDGKYAIVTSGGPFAGKFTVQIATGGPTGRKVRDLRTNMMVDGYAQYLPARYNTQSKLQAEVTSGGPNRFDFVLTSEQ